MGLAHRGRKQALARAGMGIDDVDVVELNEAFAAQVIPAAGIGIDPWDERFNPTAAPSPSVTFSA